MTFTAFLLASTVLVLSISINQTEIWQEKNIAYEAAFKEVKNRFNNIRQQISELEEEYAKSPFSKFETGEDWFLVEGKLPLEDIDPDDTYDALNLFAIFTEEKGSEGLGVEVQAVPQDSSWGGASGNGAAFVDANYFLLPQCLKVSGRSIIEDGIQKTNVRFEAGTIGDGCTSLFECAKVVLWDIDVNSCVETHISGSGCGSENTVCTGGNGLTARIISSSPPDDVLFIEIGAPVELAEGLEATFSVYMQFTEPIEEFNLVSLEGDPGGLDLFDDFNFSVKKTGFELCKGTDESSC